MPEERFVRIYRPENAFEIAQVRGAMEAADIPFYIENEHYFQTGGGIFSFGDTEVWLRVATEHVPEAKQILRDYLGAP